jgi:hypothetical protein
MFAKPVKPATTYPGRTRLRTPEGGQFSNPCPLPRVPHSRACKLLVHLALNKVSCRIRTTGCVELELLPHRSSRERAFRLLQHEISFQRVRVRAATAARHAVPRGVPRCGLGSLRCVVYPGAQSVAARRGTAAEAQNSLRCRPREPGKARLKEDESSRGPILCFCDLLKAQSPCDGDQNCQSTLTPISRGGPKITSCARAQRVAEPALPTGDSLANRSVAAGGEARLSVQENVLVSGHAVGVLPAIALVAGGSSHSA